MHVTYPLIFIPQVQNNIRHKQPLGKFFLPGLVKMVMETGFDFQQGRV